MKNIPQETIYIDVIRRDMPTTLSPTWTRGTSSWTYGGRMFDVFDRLDTLL